ncbi:ATP-dependent helicase [Propioniciclava sinopodophylli]|uniref:DNA 3'-5' helicase n=2 Tax=Propioniciclava sinopodophylli TaxID=1837344 RepID=A0A4Q9KDI5_9ACTN|nr:ATP-dependent helicase [Propioniciclava sinopodophylli]
MGDMRNVVADATGPVLVLGAAGTGKTTLVADAVAARIASGAAPALVFAATRQAASELRDAIVRRAGRTTLAPQVMTIHAFCLALLRRWADAEDALPTLLTAPEQEFRIRELLRGWRGSWPAELEAAVGTRAFAQQVRAVLARARQLGLDPDQVADAGAAAGEPGWVALGEFLAEYLDVLDAEGALDYAELVHRARILLGRPEVADSVRRQFGAVYVDDWCELDPAQIALVRGLVPDGIPVVALADPDTSIYRFRGAHPRASAEFVRLFTTPAGAPEVAVLDTAWGQGVTQAEALASVARRLGAPAVDAGAAQAYRAPRPTGQGRVQACTFADGATQARHIAGELRAAHLDDGVPWGEMAVLVRSGRRQIPPLARALADAGIPVEVAGDEIGLASELAVRPLLLALDVAGRGGVPDADEAHRLLLSGWGGFDAVSIRTLGRLLRGADAEVGGTPAPTLVAEALAGLRPVPEGVDDLADRRDLLAVAAARVTAGARPDEVLWELWAGTDWPARLRAEALRPGDGAARANRDLDAIVALFQLAHESAAPGGADGVRWFLAEVAQQQIPADSQRESAVAGRGVRVLTAHRAKGRHWAFTVVAGVQEGVWPDVRRRGSVFDAQRLSSAGLGEGVVTRELVASERRLFLLACSRAQGRLLVTAVEGTEGEDDRPSRFLTELGVPVRHVVDPPVRLHTLRALVAELRRVAQDAEAAPGLREAAAARLARLADATDADGRPLAPDADPARWWGLLAPTSLTSPPRGEVVRLSPSQLEGVLTCPRRYFLNREVKAEPPRSSTTILGSVMHAVAERAASGELTYATASELLDAVWADIPFPAAWLSASERAEADAAVERFVAWQSGHEHADVVGVEVPFEAAIEVDGEVVVLAGSVDRLERTPTGDLRVVDFKTGRSLPTQAEAAASVQLGVYQLAIEAGGFEQHAPGAHSAGASLVYLRHDATPGWPKDYRQPSLAEKPHLSDDPDELAHPTWVHHQVAQARRVLAEGSFDARPGGHCQWCPVRSSCPARSGQVV